MSFTGLFSSTGLARGAGVSTAALMLSIPLWAAAAGAADTRTASTRTLDDSAEAQHDQRSPQRAPRNVILFVADGLRHGSVNATETPTLFRVRRDGVSFINSHALFPTFTTPNASAIATSHYLGDTGDFSNTVYVGFPIFNDGNFGKTTGSPTPFIENDQVLGDIDEHFASGNFLTEESLLALARTHGFNTAAIGKLGPVGLQDVTQLNPQNGQFTIPQTVIIDDATGSASGVPLSSEITSALTAAGLGTVPTPRNQPAGNVSTPGTLSANVGQQQWFADATTKAVLPSFAQNGKPFVIVYWSRDPDGTQHNQGDSINKLAPGINGPTSRAGVANADANLKQILDYVENNPTLRATTDVFVTADHGFATISKHEIDAAGHGTQSYSTQFTYLGADGKPEVVPGWLPSGFLAIDLAHALGLPLFDPDSQVTISGALQYEPVDPTQPGSPTSRQRPAVGDGLIGGTGKIQNEIDARVIVAANGGSDLIYVADHDVGRARKIVDFLSRQDYVGGLFVDSQFGQIPGALSLDSIELEGVAQLPRPTIVVTFKTFSTDPSNPLMSAVQIADSTLQEGQGMHGSLGRDNTYNNMAAIGPDFKRSTIDYAPVSNADITRTLAHVLNLQLPSTGPLKGRILFEALRGEPDFVRVKRDVEISLDSQTDRATVLQFQQVGSRRYFDRACFIDVRRDRHGHADDTPCP